MNDGRRQLTPVSYVIFRRGDFVLLQLRRGTGYLDGYWATAAAGHVEAHESAHEAASREVQEELGVAIKASELLPLVVMHRKQDETHMGRVDFFFQCTAWPSQPRLMEQGKASDLRWFHLDDLPTSVVPHELHVLSHSGQECRGSSPSDSLQVSPIDPASTRTSGGSQTPPVKDRAAGGQSGRL